MESRYLIDWFSVTSKTLQSEDWIRLLGLQNVTFQKRSGVRGFTDLLSYDGLHIHYGGGSAGYISWLEMSGQGCRVFESYGNGNWERLIGYYLEHQDIMHMTRLDIAFDDGDTDLLDMDVLCRDTLAEEFVSKWRKGRVEQDLPLAIGGRTVYHGSPHSDFLLRIYDKARERGFMDMHWVRVELQMRDQRAASFLQTAGTLKDRLLGVLRNYVRYVDENFHDANRWRWPMKPYWEKFLDGVERVMLFDKPGVQYNVSKLEAYVFGQAGNSIYTYIKCLGWPAFWEQIREMKGHEDRLSIKHRELIAEWSGKDRQKIGRKFDENESEISPAHGPGN